MTLPKYQNEPLTDFALKDNAEKLIKSIHKVENSFDSKYSMIINGEKVERNNTFLSINPNDPRQVIGRFPVGTIEDIDRAVTAAEEAFNTWKKADPIDRAAINVKIANGFRKYRDELTALLVLEVGKSWMEADAEVAEGIDHFEYCAREMIRYSKGKELVPFASELNEYKYFPLGVGAIISPWNFPIGISTGMIAAGIVAGNTMVFKPSSDSPAISYYIMKILQEAGVPNGVVNLVYGSGSEVGEYLAGHPKVKFVGFTGSKEVGVNVAQKAVSLSNGQDWFKRTILELGGKNAIVVDSDTNLEEAAEGVLYGFIGYQGQKCSACSRAIVVEEIYDEFVELIAQKAEAVEVGPVKDQYQVGAVINQKAQDKILSYIELGKKEGRLVAGGTIEDGSGFFIRPTVFADIDQNARLAQEEIFGPVLSVIKAKDFEDAIEIANNTIYGLSGGVYTNDPLKLAKAKEDFYVGNLYLNRRNTGAWIGAHPFGGYKMSGTNSKLGGPDYLLQYMESKLITQKVTLG